MSSNCSFKPDNNCTPEMWRGIGWAIGGYQKTVPNTPIILDLDAITELSDESAVVLVSVIAVAVSNQGEGVIISHCVPSIREKLAGLCAVYGLPELTVKGKPGVDV